MSEISAWTPSFRDDQPIVSYSQNAEDIRLWRVFRTVEKGFYVDIGAADPLIDSITHLFYERGWSGINVEPTPCFEALRAERPRDQNLQVAIGETDGDVTFFLTYPYLGMSTVDPSVHRSLMDAIERIEQTSVPQRRLDSVLAKHAGSRTIHFLKVDVEGAEREVLASSDWSTFRPIVVVVEAIEPWSTAPTHEKWEDILIDAEYVFAAFDGVNRFYVNRRHDHLIPSIAYPISVLDRVVPASTQDLKDELACARDSLNRVQAELERARQNVDAGRRSLIPRATARLRGIRRG